jgi:hypothetical protein
MNLTIHPTDRMTTINGVPALIWEGKSDGGTDVICFITRIAVPAAQDCSAFERELSECEYPKPVESWPLSMII